MKRFLALAALVLGLAACQTEPEGLDVIVGGEVDTVVSVSLPEATRATSDVGFNIADTSDNYEVRYILEIYLGDSCQRHIKVADGASVAFPVRLAPGRDYTFVAWADIVEKNATDPEADRYYNTQNGLDQISIIENTEVKWNAMDETRDAFTAKEAITGFTAQAVELKLKRPFAKLRVVATDYDDVANLGLTPASAVVTYSQQMPDSFNALTGTVSSVADKQHTISYATPVYDDEDGEFTLFADYFFADNNHYIAKFSLNVYADANQPNLIKANNFTTEIFVEANKLTTIKGDVLTTGANINIDIEGEGAMDTPSYEYKAIGNATAFYEALNNGGEYIVTSNLVIDQAYVPSAQRTATRTTGATAEGKVTTINLNGKTITVTNKTGEPFATIAAGNTLFLEGGNIVLTEDSTGSFIKNEGGNVVFTNGTLENNSNSTTTTPAVVEGKVIVENATVNDDNTSKVEGTAAWLADVLTNGGTYLFTEDMTASKIIEVTATKAPVVLDGNGFTLTSSAGRAINVSGDKNVTIKNLTINASGERAINIIQNAKNITIDNVTATAANYTVNVAGSAPNAVVAINNSTLNGLCTVNVGAAGATVTVDGSTVNCNDYNTTEGESYAALCLNKDAVGSKIIATNSTINVAEGSDSTAGRNGAEDGEVTINGGVEGVVVTKAVITYPGSDYYYGFETIQAAVEFAKSGDVISLIRDVELTETLVIAEDDNVVLNLNGKTLAHAEMATNYAINNLGTLTITGNGTVNSRGIYNGYGNGEANVASAKLTIENGTFNAKGTNGGAAIYNYGVVEVKGGKFESTGGYGLNNQSGASMTITGGEIRGGIYNCGTLSVDGENTSVYQHISGRHAIYNYAATAIINNGAFDSESGNELILADGENSSVTINGGTFDKTAKSWLMGAATGKNITFLINGGTFRGYVNKPEMTVDTFRPYGDPIVVCGGNFNFNPTKFVAEGYTAVEGENGAWTVTAVTEAITTESALRAAFEQGGNIVLGADITVAETVILAEGKTAVLDLNGKKILGGLQTDTKHIYPFNIYGSLTINDSSANGSIEGRGIFVQTGSKLIVNGGSIYGIDSNGGSAIYQYGGDVTINGGLIEQKAEGTYNFAINGLGGTVTVKGGKIAGNHGAIATEAAKVVLNDGEFVCTGTAGMTDNVLYSYSSGTIIINGGTFTADNDVPAGGCCVYDANGGVTINGGVFGNSSGGDVWGTTGTTIKGGKFENLIETSHIAEGYEMNANGEVVAK